MSPDLVCENLKNIKYTKDSETLLKAQNNQPILDLLDIPSIVCSILMEKCQIESSLKCT